MSNISNPMVDAAEEFLHALAKLERVCGDFDSRTQIVSKNLAATMLLLGHELKRRTNGAPFIEVRHDGAELDVEVGP